MLDPIPATQHRPIGIQVNAVVKPISAPFKRRFNYKKANWRGFSEELEQKIKRIVPISSNYDKFANLVKKTARRHIPRGCREQYIPGLSKESSKLYEEYRTMFEDDPFSEDTIEVGKQVTESIYQERRKTWQTMIESADMSKNSKKAWSTIRKLRGDHKAPPQQPKVTANQVANQLLQNGKSGKSKKKATKLNRNKYQKNHGHTHPLTMEELDDGISSLKLGKAIGLDDISTEQIKHFGVNVKKWLIQLYNQCMSTHRLPKIWKKIPYTCSSETRERPFACQKLSTNLTPNPHIQAPRMPHTQRIGPLIDDLIILEHEDSPRTST